MSYAYTHLTHKTITDNINFMHLYYKLIRILLLIIGLCLFETPVGVTELILNYGVHTCSEIPVGITEITERILVLQRLFLSYTELILIRKYL